MSTEKIYHQDSNVTITSTRAEIFGKTYVMSNVTSVSMGVIEPSPGCAVLCLLCGVLTIFIAWGFGSDPQLITFALVIGGMGVGVVVLCLVFLKGLKRSYSVNLCSSSGETRVMTSTDQLAITKIVGAIKQAVIDSGIQKVESVSNSLSVRSGDDALVKMTTLKDMLDAGMITVQEYETKKAEILSRM